MSIYLSVDEDGTENLTTELPNRYYYPYEGYPYEKFPLKGKGYWEVYVSGKYGLNEELKKGTIEEILGYKLTWTDEPVKFEKV